MFLKIKRMKNVIIIANRIPNFSITNILFGLTCFKLFRIFFFDQYTSSVTHDIAIVPNMVLQVHGSVAYNIKTEIAIT